MKSPFNLTNSLATNLKFTNNCFDSLQIKCIFYSRQIFLFEKCAVRKCDATETVMKFYIGFFYIYAENVVLLAHFFACNHKKNSMLACP